MSYWLHWCLSLQEWFRLYWAVSYLLLHSLPLCSSVFHCLGKLRSWLLTFTIGLLKPFSPQCTNLYSFVLLISAHYLNPLFTTPVTTIHFLCASYCYSYFCYPFVILVVIFIFLCDTHYSISNLSPIHNTYSYVIDILHYILRIRNDLSQ